MQYLSRISLLSHIGLATQTVHPVRHQFIYRSIGHTYSIAMVLDKPIKKKVSLLYEYFTNEQKDRNH